MNVTLKLPDDLCQEARHRAVDESKSLSAWMADLLERELRKKNHKRGKSLLECLGDKMFTDREIPIDNRKDDSVKKDQFP